MDRNFSRWSLASIAKFFSDGQAPNTTHLWVEGQKIDYTGKDQWFELYIQGPRYKNISRLTHQYDCEILIACMSVMSEVDAYKTKKLTGVAQSILASGPIKVYRYGNDKSVDDGSFVGCYRLRDDVGHPIDGLSLGQVQTETRIQRETVEGYFRMETH